METETCECCGDPECKASDYYECPEHSCEHHDPKDRCYDCQERDQEEKDLEFEIRRGRGF